MSEPDELRAYFAKLARALTQCETDEEALQLMRDVTGLSITDPEADRAEIDRRVAAAADVSDEERTWHPPAE